VAAQPCRNNTTSGLQERATTSHHNRGSRLQARATCSAIEGELSGWRWNDDEVDRREQAPLVTNGRQRRSA
jgi:hypothetical protein